jgi:hypothetical protein
MLIPYTVILSWAQFNSMRKVTQPAVERPRLHYCFFGFV